MDRTRRLVALALLLALPGCLGPGRLTRGIDDDEKMASIVRVGVPVGTEVARARTFLESEGFRCREGTPESGPGITPMQVIWATRDDGSLVQRNWRVALLHSDGKVYEVRCRSGLTGP